MVIKILKFSSILCLFVANLTHAQIDDSKLFRLSLNKKISSDCRVVVYQSLDSKKIVIKKFIRDQDYNSFKINESISNKEIVLENLLKGKSDRHILYLNHKNIILKYRLESQGKDGVLKHEVFESIIKKITDC